ncbi:hypothetical protein [Kitasatospora indigofera]|uniref:hypothetical protein n=1 Tax=Kitasatospora indigofera TaxID=67307 RepID=UPI0033BEEF18
MAMTVTNMIISGIGALTTLTIGFKSLLDRLPEVFDSWHRARTAWSQPVESGSQDGKGFS